MMNEHRDTATVKGKHKSTFFVSGVCCATEEALVRKQLDDLVGKDGYSFNPVSCELTVRARVESGAVIAQLRRAGFAARSSNEINEPESFLQRHGTGLWTAGGALLMAVGMLVDAVAMPEMISRALLLSAIAVGGWRIFLKAARSLRILSLDMNVLMAVAAIGALMIDKWVEAAAVLLLFAASLALESYSAARSRRAIRSLMALSPNRATCLRDGGEVTVAAREVLPGERVIVRPGERIPLDGVVIEGTSLVDQSPITGEAMPLSRKEGEPVFAGSINRDGALTIRTTRAFDDSTLARIIHLVEAAQQKKAPVQTFVDRFSRIYTPAVICLAVLVAVVPPLLFAGPFVEWFYRALVLLVIACPCALVISTPVTIVSALTNAARHGILIKGGVHLEALSRVAVVALDKTGTLTEGRAVVSDIIPLNSLAEDALIRIAASLEQFSEHHLAGAVLAEAQRRAIPPSAVQDFRAHPGKGVSGTVDGTPYFLGNREYCLEQGYSAPDLEHYLRHLVLQGKTAIMLGSGAKVLGIIGIRDTPRSQSAGVIRTLKDMGLAKVVLLSGDNAGATASVAQEAGVDAYHGALLPEHKLNRVRTLQATHGTVAMVGDGVNDAPALAAASVGVAMGVSGTDAALESADVVLMSDNLERLPFLIALSRKAMRIVKQNIALALGLKLLFLGLSVGGIATLWMAVLADDGAALIVIFNGLRLLTFREQASSFGNG